MVPHLLSAACARARRWHARLRSVALLQASARLVFALLIILALGGWSGGAEKTGAIRSAGSSATGAEREYQLKAAFLFNFIRYTTWPEKAFASDKEPIVLTIIGNDPFEEQIDALFKGKEVNGRAIVIRRSSEVPDKAETHVVFASSLKAAEWAKVQQLYHKRSTLVVGEMLDVTKQGAQCNFYIEGGKVRFEINTDNLELAQLKMSSQLLKLARIVKNEKK